MGKYILEQVYYISLVPRPQVWLLPTCRLEGINNWSQGNKTGYITSYDGYHLPVLSPCCNLSLLDLHQIIQLTGTGHKQTKSNKSLGIFFHSTAFHLTHLCLWAPVWAVPILSAVSQSPNSLWSATGVYTECHTIIRMSRRLHDLLVIIHDAMLMHN